MFQRFTGEARETILRATKAVQRLGRSTINAEDILLDLLRHENCTAASVLAALGRDVSGLRTEVEERIAEGRSLAPLRTTLEFANEECCTLEHSGIGTGHLLLGLMRESSGVAAEVLRDAGLNVAEV